MRLTLVVSDVPPVTEGGATLDAPALPALAALLSGARVAPVTGGWRTALARRFAPAPARDLAAGVIASAALAQPPRGHACFATPVHLLATPDHLRMPADGLLRLPAEEGAALAADFDRTFADATLALHALHGRFLLTGLPGGGGEDPAQVLGSKLAGTAPADPVWRRLSSEIELWLHAHAVNGARSARRERSVDALWLWGGGRTPATWPMASTLSARFQGDDAFMAGLAALAGARLQPPDAPVAADDASIRDVIVQRSGAPSRDGGATLPELDAVLIAPALEQLRRGELESIDLLIGPMQATATRARLARFWRRRRPWWEYLRR